MADEPSGGFGHQCAGIAVHDRAPGPLPAGGVYMSPNFEAPWVEIGGPHSARPDSRCPDPPGPYRASASVRRRDEEAPEAEPKEEA